MTHTALGDGRGEEWREGGRYGGVLDLGGKLTAGLFIVIARISFFFVVFALPASHLQILRVGVTTQTTANHGLDASSGGIGRGGEREKNQRGIKNVAVRGLRTSIVSFV